MKKQVDTIDLTPTPQGMVDSLLLIHDNSSNPKDRAWAREELTKAMTIAYAYWYGKSKPEYKMIGIEGK